MSDKALPSGNDETHDTRNFTIKLNRCDAPDKANKLSLYPATHEFDQLKRFKAVASERIAIQKAAIGKIRRRKFKYIDEAPFDVLKALAQHDLKLLLQIQSEFDTRISQLRQKIHQEMLGDCRADDFQIKETNGTS